MLAKLPEALKRVIRALASLPSLGLILADRFYNRGAEKLRRLGSLRHQDAPKPFSKGNLPSLWKRGQGGFKKGYNFMDQILKGLYRLGGPEFPSFLVVGSRHAVQVDAGPTFVGPLYLQNIQEVLGKRRGPDFLFHTHSHFDHVGIVPYFKRTYPHIDAMASATA